MGIKVWAEAEAKLREPVPGVRVDKAERSVVGAYVEKFAEPKSRPPPLMITDVEAEILNDPRWRVPEAMVKVGVPTEFVAKDVPPAPFCLRFGKFDPDFAV